MDPARLNAMVQLATGIAIVIGLALVVWELRQAKTLARVQIGAEIAALEMARNLARMGEAHPGVYTKACLAPESLTDEEYAVEVASLRAEYNIALRISYAEAVGAFGLDWRELARSNLHYILSRPIGRARFDLLGRAVGKERELHAMARAMLESGAVTPCEQTIGIGREARGPGGGSDRAG